MLNFSIALWRTKRSGYQHAVNRTGMSPNRTGMSLNRMGMSPNRIGMCTYNYHVELKLVILSLTYPPVGHVEANNHLVLCGCCRLSHLIHLFCCEGRGRERREGGRKGGRKERREGGDSDN